MSEYKCTIRNLDPELIKRVRIDAIKNGINLGTWLNQAIKLKLGRNIKKTPN